MLIRVQTQQLHAASAGGFRARDQTKERAFTDAVGARDRINAFCLEYEVERLKHFFVVIELAELLQTQHGALFIAKKIGSRPNEGSFLSPKK